MRLTKLNTKKYAILSTDDDFYIPTDNKILNEVSDAFGKDILKDKEFLKDLSIASALIVAKN